MIEMCANVLKGRSKSFIKKNKPCSLMEAVYVETGFTQTLMWLVVVTDNQFRLAMNAQHKQVTKSLLLCVACPMSLSWSTFSGELFVLN
jgi:hypothetical protein